MSENSEKKKTRFAWGELFAFYRGEFTRLYVSLAATLGSSAMVLLIPLVVGYLVDDVLLNQEGASVLPAIFGRFFGRIGDRAYLLQNLWVFGAIILGLYALDGMFSYLNNARITRFAETGALNMRLRLFSHLQRLPFAYHKQAQTGDLVQRCTTDVDQIRRFFQMQLSEMVRCLALVVIATVMMFRLDTKMALVAIASTPILFVSSWIYFKKRRYAFRVWDEAEGVISTVLQENITGVRVVRAFDRTDFEIEKFAVHNNALNRVAKEQFRIMGDFWMASDLLAFSQLAAVIIVGAIEAIDGNISLGTLLIFISYSENLIFPLRGLARLLADAGKMQISFDRLKEILDEKPEPGDEDLLDPVLKGQVEFDRVDFAYPDDPRPVLKDVSFDIRPGQTLGILGPTGSGKSSLLQLLQRLYEPTNGSIRFDGIPATEISRESLRRQIGLILQEPFVYSRTIMENIRMPRPQASDTDVKNQAKTARLHREIQQFEDGYETMVGERGVTLSGGQKQRLTIARALIRTCPIIVFDDSLSVVDMETDCEIRRAMRRSGGSITTFIVSHRISTLMHADRIIVLSEGKVAESGTHGTLLENNGLYRRVYDIQRAYLEEDA